MNQNMELYEKLRITAGVLCIIMALLRVVLFFVDIQAAAVYSAIFINWNEAVNWVEGIGIAIIAFLFTILATGFAFLVYLILGIMVIAGRKLNVISIGCNIISGISIILCIRALTIYASQNEIHILLVIYLIIYITIFSTCLISYIKLRKEGYGPPGN